MTVLVVAEHDNKALKGATFNTVTAAKAFGPVTVLIAGEGCRSVADEAAGIAGITKVLLAEHASYRNPLAEPLSGLVVGLAKEFTHLVAPATGEPESLPDPAASRT